MYNHTCSCYGHIYMFQDVKEAIKNDMAKYAREAGLKSFEQVLSIPVYNHVMLLPTTE